MSGSPAIRVPSRNRRPGLIGLSDRLQDRDWLVLQDVSRFRLLTGLQLQRLHFGSSLADARAARRCLKRLHDLHLLARLKRRVGGIRAGSDGYIYALAQAGDRLLASRTTDGSIGSSERRARRRPREVSDGFLAHTLDVAEVYVRLQVAARLGALAVSRVEAEPGCWRRLDDGSGEWLKPDLLLVIRTAANDFHSYVELDRGTEHRPALLRKLKLYELAYRLGVVAVEPTVFPRVVWLVPDAHRAGLLKRLISSSSQLTPELHAIALHGQAVHALSGGSLHLEQLTHLPEEGTPTTGAPA